MFKKSREKSNFCELQRVEQLMPILQGKKVVYSRRIMQRVLVPAKQTIVYSIFRKTKSKKIRKTTIIGKFKQFLMIYPYRYCKRQTAAKKLDQHELGNPAVHRYL
jgi:hypothetical protein